MALKKTDSLKQTIDVLRNRVGNKQVQERPRSDISKVISGTARLAGNLAKFPFVRDMKTAGMGLGRAQGPLKRALLGKMSRH